MKHTLAGGFSFAVKSGFAHGASMYAARFDHFGDLTK